MKKKSQNTNNTKWVTLNASICFVFSVERLSRDNTDTKWLDTMLKKRFRVCLVFVSI